jgi:hypothetical protein
MADLNDFNKPDLDSLEADVPDTLLAHIRRALRWDGSGASNTFAGMVRGAFTAITGGLELRLYRRNTANTGEDEVVNLPMVSIGGNAATATKLATARTIDGVSFDGSANISAHGILVFTSSGTFTAPKAGNYYITLCGGGGGGSSGYNGPQEYDPENYGAGGGGAASAYKVLVTLSAGDQVVVTVGRGGLGGNYYDTTKNPTSNGLTGGASSFGTYVTCGGGRGASYGGGQGYCIGGSGGAPSLASGVTGLTAYGTSGVSGSKNGPIVFQNCITHLPGGNSIFSSSASVGVLGGGLTGQLGGGGSGGLGVPSGIGPGGTGGDGFCIVEW